jgi:UDP-glucose 4-epimerase
MSMRTVIIGASGNVGTALLKNLSKQADPGDVVGVCRRPPPARPPYDIASWHAIDVAGNDAARRLAAVLHPDDALVNLAWGFQPTRNVRQLERVGVGGLRAVIDAVGRVGVRHLLHMSSVGTYRAAPGVQVSESWPTDGVPTSAYSRHKAAAERLLDGVESQGDGPVVTRFRPGIIVQREAGSALLRYGVPGYVPAVLVRLLPVLPLDRRLTIPLVHADDVAAAVLSAIERKAGGAFNLAGEPAVTRDDIAAALHAHPIHVPESAIRAVVGGTFAARVQRIDAGWIDLAFAAPLLDTARARTELAWVPRVDTRAALAEVVDGMVAAASTSSPVLRPRTVGWQFRELLRTGPITTRILS